jgi:hypothetical protein
MNCYVYFHAGESSQKYELKVKQLYDLFVYISLTKPWY